MTPRDKQWIRALVLWALAASLIVGMACYNWGRRDGFDVAFQAHERFVAELDSILFGEKP